MRIFLTFLAILIFVAGVIVLRPSAAAGFIEFFFPMLAAPQDNPRDTLEAPFADREALARNKNKGLPGAEAVPIALPHRSKKQIADWLTAGVAGSLSFDQVSLADNLRKGRPFFDAGGWQQFEEFMVTAKLDQVLRSQRFSVLSFVDGAPLFLSEGVVDGRYRWLYEVPVMVSYLEKGQDSYSNKVKNPVTQNIAVTVQVGRVKDAENAEGLLIESWSARFVKNSQDEL